MLQRLPRKSKWRLFPCNRSFSTQNGSRRVIYLGGDTFSIDVLRPLLNAKGEVWDELLVVTSGEKMVGRGSRGTNVSPPLGKFAQSCGIRVDQIPTTGFKDWTIPTDFQPANTSPSPILITASFGHIIPWKFLSDHFPQPQTRLNVHPSLLPVYRGAAPIQWAIADSWRGGEKGSTGVTVQSLGRRVDCGEIWGQEGGIAIGERSRYETLMPLLAGKGGELLVSTLGKIQDGTARSILQPEEGHYDRAPKIRPSTAKVNFREQNALQIAALWRGIGYQEPIWTTINDQPLQLLEVDLIKAGPLAGLKPGQAMRDHNSNALLIKCAGPSEELLMVTKVQQAGKRALGVKDWWNGLRGMAKVKVIEMGN